MTAASPEPVPASYGYAVVIEPAGGNFSAYAPDLPGCAATGATPEETAARMAEAIAFHLDGMREDGDPIPAPAARVGYLAAA